MGHAWKQLYFGREACPSNPIYSSSNVDTWLHALLICQQQHIHALLTSIHNKVVWEVKILIVSNTNSRYFTLMNTRTHNGLLHDNTIPPRLLPCVYNAQRCHCNARLKPNILCVIGHQYNDPPPITPTS